MIRPFGERALLVELPDAEAAHALVEELRVRPLPDVTGTLPGRSSVLVELDPSADAASLEVELRRRAVDLRPTRTVGRHRTIPVCYGGELGPDLDAAAELIGRTAADVIDLHAELEHQVLFLGFAPGFPYLGELPAPLHVPRLPTPRTLTPAGSVAVAGPMTGIYPAELPGGWRVIGRTPITLFDPRREPPAYLAPGDVVRFRPIDVGEWDGFVGPPEDW